MKKSYLLFASAALLLTACSQEDLVTNVGGGNYSVTVKLPDNYATRAASVTQFGSGYVADNLYYAVYDATTLNLVAEGNTTFDDNLQTQVDFNLAKGKAYQIAFFAQSPASLASADGETPAVYTFDADNKVMEVNYAAMTSENNLADAYDCFYNLLATGEIGSDGVNTSITLYRPVAQINWGTSDLTDGSAAAMHDDAYGAEGQYIVSNLNITKAYTQLGLLSGDVVEASLTENVNIEGLAAPYNVTFPLDATSDGEATSPTVSPYVYIGMQYVLAPKTTSGAYDLSITFNNSGNTSSNVASVSTVLPVSATPVQANYQTNIYGALLTDDVNVNVVKSPKWFEPSYDLPVGDMLVPGLYYDSAADTYTIMSTNGLEYYASTLATDPNWMDSNPHPTVVLGADLDMTGVSHTPFNIQRGSFDGQGHTISNMTINVTGAGYAAFISTGLGSVKDLNFDNCKVTGNTWCAVAIANAESCTIENVNVSNSTVTSTPYKKSGSSFDEGNNVGAVAGYFINSGSGSITNCSVDNCTLIGFRKVGGLVGYVNSENAILTGNTVENTNVIADLVTNAYDDYTPQSPNIAGQLCSNGDTYDEGNTIKNVTVQILTNEISDVEGLQSLASLVNMGRNYKGYTFTLTESIDLDGVAWTPIGKSGNTFQGNFDGQGNTISNLTVNNPNSNYQGFFGYTTNGTVSNINFNNANITGENGVGVVAGCPYTTKYSGINITGEIYVEGFSYVGGAVGYNAYGALTNIVINAEPGSYVKAYSIEDGTNYQTYVGGIIGFTGEGGKVEYGLESNLDVYGSTQGIGGISGNAHYGLTFENCKCYGNVYITDPTSQHGLNTVGGIAGQWNSNANTPYVTFTDCQFTGKLISLSETLIPSIGVDGWNTNNAICGGLWSNVTPVTQLIIDGQDVTQNHLFYFPTTEQP